MKRLLILGAGTAGTMVANQLRHRLPGDWALDVVDPEPAHLYQPDLLFVPFGMQSAERLHRPRRDTLGSGISWIRDRVEEVDTSAREVLLAEHGRRPWDLLVIASGSHIHPEETEGLLGDHWHRTAHDFYTPEGAVALREALARFESGRLVTNMVEMPIKCPVAPLEFLFLADDYFKRKGNRDEVELVYATPLDGAFTKPTCSRMLSSLLEEKGVSLETEFNAASVDGDAGRLVSWDERTIDFDLLVSIPTHKGAAFIERSGLGDELDFVPTHPNSLLARDHDGIFVLGDATNLSSSKAGSVAHFQSEVVVENVLRTIAGRSLEETFDGHANCFIESGDGKALLVDFNYDVEPLPGRYPLPVVGPFSLLEESRRNHWGKLGFRWLYWNVLLPGRPVPVSNRMSMLGKRRVAA